MGPSFFFSWQLLALFALSLLFFVLSSFIIFILSRSIISTIMMISLSIAFTLSPFKDIDFKRRKPNTIVGSLDKSEDINDIKHDGFSCQRRKLCLTSTIGILGSSFSHGSNNGGVLASEFADMPAIRGKDYGKSKMKYPDYNETQSGLQYKDLRLGEGPTPKMGETVVVDWDGYTIGYYGRIFEARNKTKGGSFEGDDKDYFKFKLGSQQVIPAFEEAIVGMAPGGIRRIIVPPELGYPDSDYNKLGPKPTTFSGQRALDFVLRNQGLIDKTLLFDIELIKTIPN